MAQDDEADDFVLLSEALDGLDRLYDGKSTAVDIAAILRLAGTALSDRALGAQILVVSDGLRLAMQAAWPRELDNREAVTLTDPVRIPIAEAWADLSLSAYRTAGDQ